jgi:hypothetical protein
MTSESPPLRLKPYLPLLAPNEPVLIAKGPFRLVGDSDGVIRSDLVFRWIPAIEAEFAGIYEGTSSFSRDEWTLIGDGDEPFKAQAFVTNQQPRSDGTYVRGVVKPFEIGTESCEVLRFALANFPDYYGDPVRDHHDDMGWHAARLECRADVGTVRIDAVRTETGAMRSTGYVFSHYGEWVPASGRLTPTQAKDVLLMLHFWFGFLRGTWAGPLFPQGLVADRIVWRQIAPWKLREDQKVASWLPEHSRLNGDSAFNRFTTLWKESAWREPLINAISWLVEANSRPIVREVSIVLGQVALELLSWVWVVEQCRTHSRRDFRALSAAGRIRVLLQHVGVPGAVPDYFTDLPALCRGDDAFDGPGVIVEIRNALVHASEHKRASLRTVSSVQLYECSQLALQYVELTLLSILGYRGHYSRRGWRHGWKGQDEATVPWATG